MGTILFPWLLAVWLPFASPFGVQAAPGPTANVTLAWVPNSEAFIAGYNIYFGTASRSYSGRMFVSGTVTNATVTNLQAGQTYYFAVTAINLAGLESDYSAEVVYTPPNAVALQIRVAANGQVILTVTGPTGRTFDIQVSSNFTTWNAIGAVTIGSAGMAEFANLTPPIASAVLYRVVERLPASLQIRVATNRQAILTVTGPAGRNYDIEASSDLATWTIIGNATLGAGGSLIYADTNVAPFPRRFYRARDTQP